MNNDLISRSALLEAIVEGFFKTDPTGEEQFGYLACNRIARELPAVDTEVVRHGKWEAVENTGPEEWCAPPIRCSNCGKTMPDVGAAFCPFCGQMNAEV